jgi:hypothetical protein
MRRGLTELLVLMALLFAATRAHAQGDTRGAIELARDGKARFDAEDWEGALALFEAAEGKAHSPVLVLYAARCHRRLGKLVHARVLMASVANEILAPDATAPFRNAQTEAIAELPALEASIPKLRIDRSDVPPSWVVTVDDVAVTESEVPVDPGHHVVRAGIDGKVSFERNVEATEGAVATVTIELAEVPAPDPPPKKQRPRPRPQPVVVEQSDAVAYVPGIALLGLGVISAAVGVGLRVWALESFDEVKERCSAGSNPGKLSCDPSDEAEVDDAVRLETASTVLFAIGGAAAAAGVILLVVLPDGDEPAPSTSLVVGPGYLGVRGAF